MENVSKDKLISDLKVVLADVDGLLKMAASMSGDSADALRQKATDQMRLAADRLGDLQETVVLTGKEAAEAADDYVQANPWKAVGMAAAVGVVIGLLLNRK